MDILADRIRTAATHVGGGIIDVSSFLNHQVDASLMMAVGFEFARRFVRAGIGRPTKILTAATSGIAPALTAAWAFKIPLVFARKHETLAMADRLYLAQAPSRTSKTGEMTSLMVSYDYLNSSDRILVIDDFLASGRTIRALIKIVGKADAELVGIGVVIEKIYERGRETLSGLDVPIVALARVDLDASEESGLVVLKEKEL